VFRRVDGRLDRSLCSHNHLKREPARVCARREARRLNRLPDSELCHVCRAEFDGLCGICAKPVCDDHAVSRDHDRYCKGCFYADAS
jgi:hypothetical protein